MVQPHRNPVIVIAGAFSSLCTTAAAVLGAYVTYRHYSLPRTDRGGDVWGSMMVFSYIAFYLFGLVTLLLADDVNDQTSKEDQ